MKKVLLSFVMIMAVTGLAAQGVSVKWELSNKDNLSASVISGDGASMVSSSYLNGTNIAKTETMTASNAATGYEAVTYNPPFTMFYANTKTTGRAAGHCVSFGVTPTGTHSFKPTRLSFDAAKCGTDGGNFDVIVKQSGGAEVVLEQAISPLRNQVKDGNPNGCSHHEFYINDQIVTGKGFIVIIYFYNLNGTDTETPKAMAFRNVQLDGVIDEPIFTAENYITLLSCTTAETGSISLTSLIKGVKNGASVSYPTKLSSEPTGFNVRAKSGYTATINYKNKVAEVVVKEGEREVFKFYINFTIRGHIDRPEAKPLKRGLMSLSLSGAGMGTGNLVSWRARETDAKGTKFKLYRGTSAETQTTAVNGGKFLTTATNYNDPNGSAGSYYKLEVYDAADNLLETEVSGKTWDNQTFRIPLGNGPTDPDHGASYTPNDASYCDMDGDGEYEIILKWSPSNEKDAASTGTTSSPYFDCIKMDGTRLWRIRLGDNFFTSAHTIQFIAWDFDGDGYGEFMCKTGPGTVDGEGNYVLLGNDKPTDNLLSGRGKQDHGSEYITVFDGVTGAELATIPYHTDFEAGNGYWGDDKQNRSERYLAALAYLDGYDKNPSPIFARGYYNGAFIGAYDWDGETLKCRWVHRAYSATNGKLEYPDGTYKTLNKTVYGDGAHWISIGDVDDDGKQEIIYGSACLDHDGTCLYRTGMGHGDALHLGDMIPENEGLEVLMCHEHSPYGIDIRDARTGTVIIRQKESGDTGRGLAAHFDSSREDWQFLTSARAQMYNCSDESVNGDSWALGSSGAGINCRVYWDGDPYDEFFDKSLIAHWNPTSKSFDRFKFNNGGYLWGNLNNGTKNNPCVLGDLLGDWREEIVTWEGDASQGFTLLVNATHCTSEYLIPHLMDDYQYRCQVVNQNCCYNQPPHLSYDPAVRFAIPFKGIVPEGRYFVRNSGTGKYLQAGSSWGTRAIVGENPTMDFDLKLVDDDVYVLDSRVSNGGGAHFLTDEALPYVDGTAAKFSLSTYRNEYRMQAEKNGYLYAVNDSAEVSYSKETARADAFGRWIFVTRENLVEELKAAAAENPMDATFLIQDPNYGRNDTRYSAWVWSEDCTHSDNNGAPENFCVESWHSTFTCSQTLTDIPNGYYGLKAQGFYRIDDNDRTAPVLFANDAEQALPLLSGAENSMTDASHSFLAGNYMTDEVLAEVKDGTLKVGVRNATNKSIWVIWDNMQLTYYGSENPTGVDAVSAQSSDQADTYTLQGVRVQKSVKSGLYIKGNRKIYLQGK